MENREYYAWDEFYDMYKRSVELEDDSIYNTILDMSKDEIKKIMADAQTHDLIGTYEMVMFLESMLDYIDERDREA